MILPLSVAATRACGSTFGVSRFSANVITNISQVSSNQAPLLLLLHLTTS
jgi:hypothetical protein